LQDAATLQHSGYSHSAFGHPLFRSLEWAKFKLDVEEMITKHSSIGKSPSSMVCNEELMHQKLDLLHENSEANNELLRRLCNSVTRNPITCKDEIENGTTVSRLTHYPTTKPHSPPPMNYKQFTAIEDLWAAL